MTLDARGDVSVLELVFYIPLLCVSILLIIKHGLKRTGWFFLSWLSIVRIIGAITHIISENTKNPSVALRITFSTLEASGVCPLLLASLGLLVTVKQHGFEDKRRLHLLLRLLQIATHVALILAICGGIFIGTGKDIAKIKLGINLRHIGGIIFLVVFILVSGSALVLWMNKDRVLKHRQTLLLGVAVSLPFLAVRVLYTVLSAYAPTGIPGVDSGDSNLADFNSTTGNFAVYLGMSVIMEMGVVIIYAAIGLMASPDKDYAKESSWSADEEDGYSLNAPAHQQAQYISLNR